MRKHEKLFDKNNIVVLDISDMQLLLKTMDVGEECSVEFFDPESMEGVLLNTIHPIIGEIEIAGLPKIKEIACHLQDWQKATAKAIFELMPDVDMITKHEGVCELKADNGVYMAGLTDLSIDLFPFEETGEIRREDVL